MGQLVDNKTLPTCPKAIKGQRTKPTKNLVWSTFYHLSDKLKLHTISTKEKLRFISFSCDNYLDQYHSNGPATVFCFLNKKMLLKRVSVNYSEAKQT